MCVGGGGGGGDIENYLHNVQLSILDLKRGNGSLSFSSPLPHGYNKSPPLIGVHRSNGKSVSLPSVRITCPHRLCA